MVCKLNDKEVEVELDSNKDGSRFIAAGYYTDTHVDLTSDELDMLQSDYDDLINSMWG
jgi:hypothetical protein